VKKAIVSEQLKPGDQFPSVREIARELRINPNTAQKVIVHLVREGLLEIKPGIGSVVSELSVATNAQRDKILNDEIEKLVVECKRLSITKKKGPEMNNIIETRNLTKRFDKNTAVQSLNLTVSAGSIFAFLGPNGAGKTTTIKTLMNIIKPTQGSATVLGADSQKLGPEQFAQIGYVSENQEMPEWMTVNQFLNYCRKMYSTWDDRFCHDLVEQFNLPLKQKLKSVSRGMKMKAALVSSLAYRPQLLILDEPFSGLDPLVRDEFVSGVLNITEDENWTIFISSHDIDEVERLADWVGIIDKGLLKIVEQAESLQNRFRRVELALKEPVDIKSFPESWYLPQQQGRTIHFIDSQYEVQKSEDKIRNIFPNCSNIEVSGMSLREIFVAFARKFRISEL
jgi:ABC-2 type transport system ATP-binding protein